MSTDFRVPYTAIRDIQPHGNAERLEVATIYGFQVITQRGKYKVGDPVVYIPIDSILPQGLEDQLFPEGSKIRLNNHRVRQIRIRGLASQGMFVHPSEIFRDGAQGTLENDYAESLGITKYEPPVRGQNMSTGPKGRNRKADHPMFHKYNGLDNIKWFPDLFRSDESVVIQEKLHGTNARAGILPYNAGRNPWKRLLVALGFAPKWENHYGSNNVQISGKMQGPVARFLQKLGFRNGLYTGYYGGDIYGTTFANCQTFERIRPGEIVYGEIIGQGIQMNYDYGHTEPKFVLFDVKILQPDGSFIWLSPHEVEAYAAERGFTMVPALYMGPWDRDLAYRLTSGPSMYHPQQKVREGIVIKSVLNYSVDGNKRALKWVSEDYLADDKNTDNH